MKKGIIKENKCLKQKKKILSKGRAVEKEKGESGSAAPE